MTFDYDPERGLWRPGRRAFIFLSGSAALGVLVGRGGFPPASSAFPVGTPVILHGGETVVPLIEVFGIAGRPAVLPLKDVVHHGLLQPYSVHQSVWRLSRDAQILWRPVQRKQEPPEPEVHPHVHKYGRPWGGAEPPATSLVREGFLPGDSVGVPEGKIPSEYSK